MKMSIKNPFLLATLSAGLGMLLAGRMTAQTFTTLHSFNALNNSTNSDGANPFSGLIGSGKTLYGTAAAGGSIGYGTVFAINTDGAGFTNLDNFGGGSDGASPTAGLILAGNTLYGTAAEGGSSSNGTVFAVHTDGSGFTNLHSFSALSVGDTGTNSDGAAPAAGLIVAGDTLFGTAELGGEGGSGTAFAVNTNGSGFTNLHSFNALHNLTNSDGANPYDGLVLAGNTLFGTAINGGASGNGTVFAINIDGTGFRNLHSFTTEFTDVSTGSNTNNDGANPLAGLIVSGNTVYGTARQGGSSGNGTVFAVNTNGTDFTNLYSFTTPIPGSETNNDGAYPSAGLILLGDTLYGTAQEGGSSANGTVFKVNTDGTSFTNLYSFSATSSSAPFTNGDGTFPQAGLVLSGNTLYGTAELGGRGGSGTVFSISFPPQLAIIASRSIVALRWPTNNGGFSYTGYTLQSTTNLDSPAVWTNVAPSSVVVSGQNTVTNPISGAKRFFRLNQ
jgi:uncharacterized repeat protein (TIGR03803 family)